jgi:uncharacterized membrane protein
MIENPPPLITDAVVLGILMTILGLIFITSSSENLFKKFYGIVPFYYAILFRHFSTPLTSYLESSSLYTIASRYLLPASLVLLTLSINFAALKKLGSKAIIMFFSWNLV